MSEPRRRRAKDACDLAGSELDARLSQRVPIPRGPVVPVPIPGVENENQFPEPPGTGRNHLFEPLEDFMARAANLPDPAWLLEGLIPEVGQVWILGAPGCGKTWFALCVARLAARKGRDVFVVEEEGSTKGLHNRFRELGFEAAESARVSVAHAKGLKLGQRLEELIAAVKGADEPVLILDPMTALFVGDENATEDASQFRDQLGQLLRAHGRMLVLVLHHTSKGAERGDASTYAGRGSSVFTGAADLELLFRRRPVSKASGTISFGVSVAKPPRELEAPEPATLTIQLGTGELTHAPVGDEGDDRVRASITEVLRSAIEPMSKNGIAKSVGAKKQRVLKAIDSMVEDGALEKSGERYHLPAPTAEVAS